MSLISSFCPSLLKKSTLVRDSSDLLAEDDDDPRALENHPSLEDRCLEGFLMTRKGRATGAGSVRWKRRFVELNFARGGSLTVYEDDHGLNQEPRHSKLFACVPSDLEWVAKDVHNTTSTFAIEIPTDRDCSITSTERQHLSDTTSVGQHSESDGSRVDDLESLTDKADEDLENLNDEISNAKRKGKPIRIYFKCLKGSNEKALWLDAFSKIHRLSIEMRHTHGIRSSISNGVRVLTPHRGRARTRTHNVDQFRPSIVVAEDVEMEGESELDAVTARINQICYGKPMKRNEGKEFMAIPGYAYPHRWMNIPELYEEMMLPSSHFHDLRDPDRLKEEIGHLNVEVLQCVGLPRLDRASDTDAVVYLVCGSSAFSTDVIPDRTNPMWLRKSKRACIFPIYHGYARLYVGVFDDDGENAKDDFAGRVVIDIARLRHSSTYDVILPLRLSAHVYNRRKRGSVRLRFTFFVKSEKDMILSYIPKKFKVLTPESSKPDVSTTVACANPKAFRNAAITVHGLDMPGRFTFSKIKAEIKEISLVIRFILATIMKEIHDIKTWQNPVMSAFIFFAWMHCIYEAKFSLFPGYLGIYILLQLTRMYAIFAVERTKQEGFVPPTFEEMVYSVIAKRSVEPLEMHRVGPSGIRASCINVNPTGPVNAAFKPQKMMRIKTHEPQGIWLFKCLGFLPRDESLSSNRNLHLEFPYADGNAYEKFGLIESLADIHPAQDDPSDGHDDPYNSESSHDLLVEETSPALSSVSKKSIISKISPRWQANLSVVSRGGEVFGGMEFVADNLDDDVDEDDDDSSESQTLHGDRTGEYRDPGFNNPSNAATTGEPLAVSKEQNLDWRPPGRSEQGEKLTDTLNRLSYKLHSLTLHSFNDYVYDVKSPDSVYFAQTKNMEKGGSERKKRKKNKILRKKLDRLLNVNEYSNSHNPIANRVGLLVEPMVGAVYGFICFFRAFYNVVTWQDPYLSFLVFVGVVAVTFVLFWVPWRPVLLLVGILFVGPQNWLVRVLRANGTLPPPKSREPKNEVEEESPDNMVFFGHKRLDGVAASKQPLDPDPLEVQHIVVPYNRAMYQRFYDWPPEQQYATVDPVKRGKVLGELKSTQKRVNSSANFSIHVSGDENKHPRFHRIRALGRRFRKEKDPTPQVGFLYDLSEENSSMDLDGAPTPCKSGSSG